MLKYMNIKIYLFVIIGASLVYQSAVAENVTSKFSEITYTFSEGDWFPIIYKKGKNKGNLDSCEHYDGLFIEILNKIFKEKLELNLYCKVLPWKRAQTSVKMGKTDFLITVPTESRLDYSIKSNEPIFQLYMQVYTYKNHKLLDEIKKIKTVEDIIRLKLTAVTNLGNEWHNENIDVHGVPTHHLRDENLVEFLAAKRADILIDSIISTNNKIESLGLSSKIEATNVRFGPLDFHILVSKNSPKVTLMPEINNVIKSLKKNGTLDELISQYMELR